MGSATASAKRDVGDLLPARYHTRWREPFERPIESRLAPGVSVLDIGSGRHPAVPIDRRPEGVEYVGLDLSGDELRAAGDGAYTEAIEADATQLRSDLVDRFELVVSWQVLEHVKDLPRTFDNIRQYLRPGGTCVALFSGGWSAFGVINRVLPHRLGKRIVEPIMHRKETNTPVFPAYYDHCTARALERILAGWTQTEVEPLYAGATYFTFSTPVLRAYLVYENLIANRRVANLATHYLVIATR